MNFRNHINTDFWERSGKWLLAAVAAISIGGAGVIIMFDQVVSRRQYGQDSRKPALILEIRNNGETLERGDSAFINVVRGKEVTPYARIEWRGNAGKMVELEWNGESEKVALDSDGNAVISGPQMTFEKLGYCSLRATLRAKGLVVPESLMIEVTRRPRYRVNLKVEHIEVPGPEQIEIDVRLSSANLDLEDLLLSHVTLWLLDDKGNTLSRLPVAQKLEGSGESRYRAVYEGGEWVLHFSKASGQSDMKATPTRTMLTGSVRDGDDKIEITVEPLSLQVPTQ